MGSTRYKGRHNNSTDMAQQGRAIISHDTYANGGWKLEDVTVRQPGEGELLVEMVASVCRACIGRLIR